MLGRVHVQADDIADLGDELRVRCSASTSPRGAASARRPARSATPTTATARSRPAIDRVDQCVSWPGPFSVRTRVTTTSTCSSVIFRGDPGLGASARPSSLAIGEPDPPLADRSPATPPVLAATAVSGAVPSSSAQASTIRARSASDCDAVRLRTSASSDSRSASESSSGTSFGLGTRQAYNLQLYF